MLLVPRLNAYFPRSDVDRATSQAVEKLHSSNRTLNEWASFFICHCWRIQLPSLAWQPYRDPTHSIVHSGEVAIMNAQPASCVDTSWYQEWCPGLPSLVPCTRRTVLLSYGYRGHPLGSCLFLIPHPSHLSCLSCPMVPWDPMGTGLGIIPCIPSHGPPVLLSILSRSPVGNYGMSLGIPCVASHRPLSYCPSCPEVLWEPMGCPWESHAFHHTDPSVLLSILSHGPVGTHGMSLGIPCVPSHRPLCPTVHPVPWSRGNPWDVLGNAMPSNTHTPYVLGNVLHHNQYIIL